jgi:hypothetical protein
MILPLLLKCNCVTPIFERCDFSLNYSHGNAILPLANHKNSGKYTKVRGKIALACAYLRAKSQS